MIINPQKHKMVGCWHGCLAAKEPISTGSLFIYTVHWLLYASYITYSYMSGNWHQYLQFSFVTFLSLSGNFLHFTVGSHKQNQRDTNSNKKEVSTCTHIHHLNMYMCDQEHMWLTGSLNGLKRTIWHNRWCSFHAYSYITGDAHVVTCTCIPSETVNALLL